MHALLLMSLLASVSDEPYQAWESTVVRSSAKRAAKSEAGHRLAPAEIAKLVESPPPIPFREVTVAVGFPDGTVWAGSPRGLMRKEPGGGRWRLFHSRRWLLDDRVADLTVLSKSSVYVKTPRGVNWIRRRSTTLSKKMADVLANLRKRHVRLGLVGQIHLAAPGLLERGWKQYDDDNDGLWTSMYVAAESFRFAATGDAQARENANRSLRALMFLEKITGAPGYVARSVVPASVHAMNDRERWRVSKDRQWQWKSDTSSDEVDGHYFAYSIYYDLAATPAEKEEIRQVVARITDHILDNNLYYLDPDGKRTTWGVWNPKEINGDPRWSDEHGLNPLEILSHLKVASHIVGKPRYEQQARELIEKHGYANNTINQKITQPPDAVNHSDDELAFLAYYPLLRYERDPKLRGTYMKSIERSWQIERPERSPLFNFIYAAALQGEKWTDASARPPEPFIDAASYDREACVDWFREVPTDLVCWTVDNTGRNDASTDPFSVFERGIMKWNGNPYELKTGSDGRTRDDGTFILLPYWMGVYHRFID